MLAEWIHLMQRPTSYLILVLIVPLQDLDELEQEVDQMAPESVTDCDCGMDAGEELIEGRRGMLAVSSQALLTTGPAQ